MEPIEPKPKYYIRITRGSRSEMTIVFTDDLIVCERIFCDLLEIVSSNALAEACLIDSMEMQISHNPNLFTVWRRI